MKERKTTIDRPIFIVGSGRSGTTLIYRLLANHSRVAWFSNWTNRFPQWPQLSFLSRGYQPQNKHSSLNPSPAIEGNGIYTYCKLHDIHYQKQRAINLDDVTPSVTRRLKWIIGQHLYYHGRQRFLHKNTNNSMRIDYLKKAFPDARFIHIVRDGRAVALSLYNVAFWKELDLWWTDTSPQQWEADGKDPLILCGLHWQRQVNEIIQASEYLSREQYLMVRYEDFVATPQNCLQKITAFCDLPIDSNLRTDINKKTVSNRNTRWHETVPEESISILNDTIGETLAKLDYT